MFLPVLTLSSGCASLTLMDKTSAVVEEPHDVLSAVRKGEDVVITYGTSMQYAMGETVFGTKRSASFRLSHASGTNVVNGNQTTFVGDLQSGAATQTVQVSQSDELPLNILWIDGVVVWGHYVNQSYILEILPDGSIGWNKCRVENVVHERGWWALPSRIVLFPVAVALDVATVPLIVAISPLLFYEMAHCR